MKNDEPLILPLVGRLEGISSLLKEMRKSFPKPTDRVFNFRNFRFAWNKTCDRLGRGKFDKKLRHYDGLKPHDFRRSASRNLIKSSDCHAGHGAQDGPHLRTLQHQGD